MNYKGKAPYLDRKFRQKFSATDSMSFLAKFFGLFNFAENLNRKKSRKFTAVKLTKFSAGNFSRKFWYISAEIFGFIVPKFSDQIGRIFGFVFAKIFGKYESKMSPNFSRKFRLKFRQSFWQNFAEIFWLGDWCKPIISANSGLKIGQNKWRKISVKIFKEKIGRKYWLRFFPEKSFEIFG